MLKNAINPAFRTVGEVEAEPSQAEPLLKTTQRGPIADEPITFQPPEGTPPWLLRLYNEATAALHRLHVEIDESERALRNFRADHCCFVAGAVMLKASNIRERPLLDQKHERLVLNHRSLLARSHKLMHERAEILKLFSKEAT